MLCPRKIFRHGNKNTLSLVMVYSVLFNNVFKALNFFWNKYVTQIQLPDNDIWLLSTPQKFYTEFWHGLALVINITKCKEQRQLQFTVACSWAFLLKPWEWQALLSFHHTAKPASPHHSSSYNLGKLAFRAASLSPSQVKRRKKGNGLQSVEIHRRWFEMPSSAR
jgi:hypothetical protein